MTDTTPRTPIDVPITRTITAAEVTPIIEAVVAEFGADHTYVPPEQAGSCFYRTPHYDEEYGTVDYTEGAPGCLVGHVLDRLGVLPERLYDHLEAHRVGEDVALENLLAGQVLNVLVTSQGIAFEPAVHDALASAQTRQDSGRNWGSALDQYRHALRMAGELDD